MTTEQHLQGVHQIDRYREMPYLVWLPDGYGENRDRRYPLIVFLHGTADIRYDPAFVMSHGLPAVLAQDEQPKGFDFVVVSPQAVDGTEWWTRNVPEWVDGFVESVLDTYLVDRNRVYLTGIGTGGNGSWHLATRYSDRYAAVASVSGSGFGSTVPHHFALAPDGEVWVSDNGGSAIVRFGTTPTSVEVGPVPHHLAVIGDLVVVAVSGSGQAVFVRNDAIVGTATLTRGLHGVAIVHLPTPPAA